MQTTRNFSKLTVKYVFVVSITIQIKYFTVINATRVFIWLVMAYNKFQRMKLTIVITVKQCKEKIQRK